MKQNRWIAGVLAAIWMIVFSQPAYAQERYRGSAGNISGKTVIISILADDDSTTWDNMEAVEQMRKYMVAATNWLSACVSAYGGRAEFICDWNSVDDLLYSATFTGDFVTPDGSRYWDQQRWLEQYFPIEEMKKKFGADNVIYIFWFNTPYSNPIHPFSQTCTRQFPLEYEIINDFVHFEGYDTYPANIAHEILHCFGARDLYYANQDIPQAYVDYLASISSGDIMYSTYIGDYVLNTFTPLCAYYVGLLKDCPAVSQWGLAVSDYVD